MELTIPAVLALAAQCAPGVAPETLLSIVAVESGFNPLAIGVNGRPRVTVAASFPREAVTRATALIASGRSVDLGLAQINSANLGWLGMSVADAFDPCRNLSAAGRVLQDGFRRSAGSGVGAQAALQTALSYYNTGHPRRGFDNGYVARVLRASARYTPYAGPVPSVMPSALGPAEPIPAAAPVAAPAPWDVFGQSPVPAGFVLSPSSPVSGDRP